ncbi:peptidoglycan DD-metalloendopeptidase family protein [Luteimonas sp. A501]
MSLSALDIWWFHAGACLFAGALAWSLGLVLHHGLRISHAARSYWLVVWALAILPTLLAIAFHGFASVGANWSLPTPLPLPSVAGLGGWSSGLEAPWQDAVQPLGARAWQEPLLPMLYLAGAGLAALRWGRGMLAVRRIVRASSLVVPAALPGPLSAMEQQRLHRLGIELRSTTRQVSPFAVCWPRRAIIIPAALAARLEDRQLQMVLRHEASHLARHDPQRAALMRLVGVVLWFNPFLGLIERRVQVAAELCCDAAAAGVEPEARHVYARAYLEALRLSARSQMPSPVAAFSRHDPGSHRLRIRHMVQGDARRRLALPWRIALLALALVAGGAVAAVQIGTVTPGRDRAGIEEAAGGPRAAVVSIVAPVRREAAAPEATADVTARPAIGFRFPVTAPRVSSRYGAEGGPYTRPHRGIDFAAARGTPVYAPAAATVAAATTNYPDGPNYGTVVVLDHGGGWQSLHAHLDGFDVQVGQRVAAGTQIGRAGTTGKVTGPHLHMELLLDGQRVDPEPLLR